MEQVDDLKRQLDAVDSSPTVQAVLVLAGFYVRYLVWKGMQKLNTVKAKRKAKQIENKRISEGSGAEPA